MKIYIMDFGIVLISGYKKVRYFTLPDKNSVRRMVDALMKHQARLDVYLLSDDFLDSYVCCETTKELMSYYEENYRPLSRNFSIFNVW